MKKQLIVPNKKLRHTIQMTNNRPVYILPLVNYNVYWLIIGHLYWTMLLVAKLLYNSLCPSVRNAMGEMGFTQHL